MTVSNFQYFISELKTNSGLVALLSLTISSIFGLIVLALTHTLELKKFRQNILLEKKYKAYFKYFELFNDFYHSSKKTAINFENLKSGDFKDEEKFEDFKKEVIEQYQEFLEIKSKLSMPGAEMLIFVNKKISEKIKEITSLNGNAITFDADIKENGEKLLKYITKISELMDLLKEDLGINS